MKNLADPFREKNGPNARQRRKRAVYKLARKRTTRRRLNDEARRQA